MIKTRGILNLGNANLPINFKTKKEVKKYGAHDTEIPTLNNIYSSE